jgi:hypothetical protein
MKDEVGNSFQLEKISRHKLDRSLAFFASLIRYVPNLAASDFCNKTISVVLEVLKVNSNGNFTEFSDLVRITNFFYHFFL